MKNAKYLLEKFKQGTCTEEERLLIEKWLLTYESDKASGLSVDDFAEIREEMWNDIEGKKRTSAAKRFTWRPALTFGAAAAVILITIGLGLFFNYGLEDKPLTGNEYSQEIKPGGNKAFLTLSDGRRVNLTDIENSKLVRQSGIQIAKNDDGKLVYTISDIESSNVDLGYNTIEIPVGGQYQVNLPDGTNVWLNSSSSLTYPTNFKNQKERKVQLKGEAYFEVAHNASMPFIVTTDKQKVEVLGTHFNINSYQNEPFTETTLLEGAVKVSSLSTGDFKMLKPGEKSLISETEKLVVSAADIDKEIAWKNGFFRFDDMEIKEILRTISRWYDVDVLYQGDTPDTKFSGRISKYKSIKQVLTMLESTGKVHFTMEERRITITK